VSEPPEMDLATTRDLVEELLRTSFALQDVMTALLGAIRERVLTDLRTAAESADRKTEK
jgi:hypothetical protein